MKVSISLPDADVTFLDAYAKENGLESRSAAVHTAVRALRATQLEEAYAEAYAEWEGSEDQAFWDSFVADGLADNEDDRGE
jgi:Arc/MetJ-type ribon-helix-helix transcriptional regulator